MASTQQLLLGEGAGGAEKNYIEDVFSTYLYTGTGIGVSNTIVNNIDLAAEGGLVWTKARSEAYQHVLNNTTSGFSNYLISNSDVPQNYYGSLATFTANSDGYTFLDINGAYNNSGKTFVSWTFRKQPKFFDVVTYTGNGTSGRTVAHSLGSTPGCIIVKRTSGDPIEWAVYHRSLDATSPQNYYLRLNTTAARALQSGNWNDTAPTSTVFTLGDSGAVNTNGETYVAYLFAHDAGGFGLTGTDNVISCGTYTGTGTAGLTVSLGYEPQWVLIKKSNGADYWYIEDNMRGMPTTPGNTSGAALFANDSMAEYGSNVNIYPTATGFVLNNTNGGLNASGGSYIYIAIRRGPMKVPTDGTKVFSPNAYTEILTNPTVMSAGFPPDMYMTSTRQPSYGFYLMDKLRGSTQTYNNYLVTSSTGGEGTTGAAPARFDLSNDGLAITYLSNNTAGRTDILHQFRRAPSFFDEVILNNSTSTYTHNLTVAPELIFVKCTSASGANWVVYSKSISSPTTQYLNLNTTGAEQLYGTNAWSTSATQFSVDTGLWANGTYGVAYMFATCLGVSKVGSYTGNGGSQTIACGFTAGSRYVMVKRTDSTGNWYVWDTARGIVSGADPYLLYNSNISEASSDAVDADSSGFIVNQVSDTNINVNGATYIFLAIA